MPILRTTIQRRCSPLRASVVARGPTGERLIPIDEFFVDTFTTVLEPNEILTEIRIPKPPARKWRRVSEARA